MYTWSGVLADVKFVMAQSASFWLPYDYFKKRLQKYTYSIKQINQEAAAGNWYLTSSR